MCAEDLLVNNSADGETVKTIGEGLPQLYVVASLAFVIKPVYPVDAGAFVVAAEDEEVLRVFYLIREQQTYGLQRLLASVDIVAEK